MAYGKIKADKIVYDDGVSDIEVDVSALVGAGVTAPLNNPAFTGTPTAPAVTYNAASPSTTQQLATHGYVEQAIPARIYYYAAAANTAQLSANNNYTTDTTSAAYSINLPTSPSVGDTIRVVDAAGTWATNNLTVARSGENIAGAANDLVCNVNNAAVTLIYSGSTVGWLIK